MSSATSKHLTSEKMAELSSPSSASPTASHNAAASPAAPGHNNPLLASPNPIPPRTSSTGLHSRASSQSQNLSFTQPASLPAVLHPVSEADWLSQRRQTTNWRSPTLSPGVMAIMQHQAQPPQPGAPPQPLNVDRYAHDDLNFTPKRSWTDDKEKVIRAPFEYAISHPGKDFRAQLIAAFNAWLDVPPASLDVITKVVAMLHESSLLVDDVQDSSELRRGFPVAHAIFGVPQTINSANYICYVALQELQRLDNPRCISIFAEELVNLHRGQGMDLFWRDTLTCPTEEDYLEMVGNKTGGLFRLGIKLMQAESSTLIDCVPLINLVGLIYQIRDDYMNLNSKEYTENKGMCEDLTEGKFSFPIIHSIRADSANLQLINILKQKTYDTQVKRYAVSYMESTGSFTYTRAVLATLIERARRMAMEMDEGVGKASGILRIVDKMVIE
ncbi:Geranylgeranyl pyrophosphate synthase [Tolypocladium ophioglossoides CBS 100239]|uniref:Geranylgeranyl pyrophosphate synthase n=1 Tax=Tolypocladium ophioglossoides (strain CBS 100239) TaxID=1163406 RepID=A0A0L0NCA3_TOLOC|nr:Geranylgeranyl pyrophosphate synthase [Tolypocladium ophioglossoides CBS 100239]